MATSWQFGDDLVDSDDGSVEVLGTNDEPYTPGTQGMRYAYGGEARGLVDIDTSCEEDVAPDDEVQLDDREGRENEADDEGARDVSETVSDTVDDPIEAPPQGRRPLGPGGRRQYEEGVQRNFYSLTYPRCDVDPKRYVELAKQWRCFPRVGYIAAVSEAHADDGVAGVTIGKHLHVMIYFPTRYRVRYMRTFDIDTGDRRYHPNVQSTWKPVDWFAYMSKEAVPYEWVRPNTNFPGGLKRPFGQTGGAAAAAKKNRTHDAFMRIMEGEDKETLALTPEFTSIVLQHGAKMEAFREVLGKRKKPSLRSWGTAEYTPIGVQNVDEANEAIVKWLNASLIEPEKRPIRSSALFLVGPTGVGKTNLVYQLQKFFRVYKPVRGGEYYDHYDDKSYDLWFFEEFIGERPIQDMNEILDGGQVSLNARYRTILKSKNLPVIIASNRGTHRLYEKAQQEGRMQEYDAFISRLCVVNVPSMPRAINIRFRDAAGELVE